MRARDVRLLAQLICGANLLPVSVYRGDYRARLAVLDGLVRFAAKTNCDLFCCSSDYSVCARLTRDSQTSDPHCLRLHLASKQMCSITQQSSCKDHRSSAIGVFGKRFSENYLTVCYTDSWLNRMLREFYIFDSITNDEHGHLLSFKFTHLPATWCHIEKRSK